MEVTSFKKLDKKMLVEPTVFYNMNDNDQEDYISKVKFFINSNVLLKRMDNIVRRNVKHYKTDFYVHDVFSLSDDNGDFVWLVRECGTDLIRCNNNSFSKDGEWIGKIWFNAVNETSKVHRYYYFNSNKNKLLKINQEKAEQLIDEFNEINLNKHEC